MGSRFISSLGILLHLVAGLRLDLKKTPEAAVESCSCTHCEVQEDRDERGEPGVIALSCAKKNEVNGLCFSNEEKEDDTERFCLQSCKATQIQKEGKCELKKKGDEESVMFVRFEDKARKMKEEEGEEKVDPKLEQPLHMEETAKGALEKTELLANKSVEAVAEAETTFKKNEGMFETLAKLAADAGDSESQLQQSVKGMRQLLSQAQEAANDAIKKGGYAVTAREQVADESLAKSKAENMKKAAKLKEEMVGKADAEGAKAAEPYVDAMNRATSMAGVYSSRGDGLAATSMGLQGKAQQLLMDANNFQLTGDVHNMQKAIQMSHQTMLQAQDLMSAADGNYGTAKGIMDSLPLYGNEIGAAMYHAAYLLNPDMPPPPAPIS